MTEAMSRREIEDVLTSVRRLVSQDAKIANALPDDALAVSMQTSEKLVLTSALRVDAPVAEPEPEEQLAPAPPRGGVAPCDEGWITRADSGPLDELTSLFADVSGGEPPEVVAEPPAEAAAHASLLARIQSIGVAASTAQSEHPAPQTHSAQSDDAPPLGAFRRARMPHATASEGSEERWRDGFAEANPQVPPHRAPPAATELAQSVEDATLEATLSRIEALLAGNPLPTPEPAQPEERAETENDTVIDETMLHQLVAHIVRQELQGELGEKITRNIRKLVRAEVARELALRKL